MGNGGQPLALPDAPPPPGDVVALRVVSEQDARTAAVAAVAAVAPVAAVAASSPSLSAAEVTALVGLFQGMLSGTENRILAAMADNSRAAGERWAKHDAELAANTARVTARFLDLDARLQTTADTLQAYLSREHDDDVAMQARIQPIRGSIAWLWLHWKELALFLLGLATLVNVMLNALQVAIDTGAR